MYYSTNGSCYALCRSGKQISIRPAAAKIPKAAPLHRIQQEAPKLRQRMQADPGSTTDYGAMFAMSTLSLIPVFLIFLFFNRYLVQGIGTSGLKG